MGLLNYITKKTTLAPIEVNVNSAEVNSLVFKTLALEIATSYLANIISKCEFKVFEGGKEQKNLLYYLLNVSPNPNENATQFKQRLVHNVVYDGHALLFNRNNNFYIADSFGMTEYPFASNVFENISLGGENLAGTRRAEDVCYFKMHEKNITDLVTSLYSDFDKIVETACAAYKNQVAEKYKLTVGSTPTGDPAEVEQYKEALKKQLESFTNNQRSVYVQQKGTDMEMLFRADNKTDSADILALRKDCFETVATAFKMPVSMLYGNMTNTKDILNAWITVMVDPFCQMINEEFTRRNYSMTDINGGNCIKVDTTAIIHMDLFDIADNADKFIGSGIFCIDDILEKIGEPKLNTEFSQTRWITKNYDKAEDALTREGGNNNG